LKSLGQEQPGERRAGQHRQNQRPAMPCRPRPGHDRISAVHGGGFPPCAREGV